MVTDGRERVAKAPYTLKVREGGKTRREAFESQAELFEAADRHSRELAARAPGKPVKTPLRDYDPVEQVAGRVELFRRGHRPFLGEHAGIDVRGDGSMEAWLGRTSRRVIEQAPGESVLAALRREFGR